VATEDFGGKPFPQHELNPKVAKLLLDKEQKF
jgi:hypothetical protein